MNEVYDEGSRSPFAKQMENIASNMCANDEVGYMVNGNRGITFPISEWGSYSSSFRILKKSHPLKQALHPSPKYSSHKISMTS